MKPKLLLLRADVAMNENNVGDESEAILKYLWELSIRYSGLHNCISERVCDPDVSVTLLTKGFGFVFHAGSSDWGILRGKVRKFEAEAEFDSFLKAFTYQQLHEALKAEIPFNYQNPTLQRKFQILQTLSRSEEVTEEALGVIWSLINEDEVDGRKKTKRDIRLTVHERAEKRLQSFNVHESPGESRRWVSEENP